MIIVVANKKIGGSEMNAKKIETLKFWKFFIIFLLVISFDTKLLNATINQPEFEIYLQIIEEVKEEPIQNPSNWWEQLKSFVNTGAKYIDMGLSQFKMRFFPKEGEYWVRSTENVNLKYRLKSVKIKSEEDLFKVWGVKSESELNNGQKAILAAFRTAYSDAIKYRAKYAYRKSPVQVIFTDTSKFDHIPTVKMDFWPMSLGSIQMSTFNFNFPGSEEYARLTFIHEYAHTLDRSNPVGIVREAIRTTITQGSALYGKDKTHYVNEKTTPRVAFLEGWAIFNEMIESEKAAKEVFNAIKSIAYEQSSGYIYKSAESQEVTVKDLLSTEGVVATILYKLAKDGFEGKDGVFKAFVTCNKKFYKTCEIKDLLRSYLKLYPQDEALIVKILQEVTYNKISSDEVSALLGRKVNINASNNNSSNYGSVATATTINSSEQETNASQQNQIKVNGSSTNPFADN